MAILHNACCLEVMKGMADNSIDLICTDPPYYSTNLHFDKEPRIDFDFWLKECKRVLKESGILVSFCDLNLLIELRSCKIFKSCYELIWQKNRAANFCLANKMPMRVHEFILVMKNQQGTFNKQLISRSEKSLKRDPAGTFRAISLSGESKITGVKKKNQAIALKVDLKILSLFYAFQWSKVITDSLSTLHKSRLIWQAG